MNNIILSKIICINKYFFFFINIYINKKKDVKDLFSYQGSLTLKEELLLFAQNYKTKGSPDIISEENA